MLELLLSDSAVLVNTATLADTAARARHALSRSRIYDLRRLSVDQDGQAVVLRGRVSSFYHKQLAQEVVRNAIDGNEVINAIRVIYLADRREADQRDAAERIW